jgi:hypothetical protein
VRAAQDCGILAGSIRFGGFEGLSAPRLDVRAVTVFRFFALCEWFEAVLGSGLRFCLVLKRIMKKP